MADENGLLGGVHGGLGHVVHQASKEALRPRVLDMGISRPASSTWSTGLMESMVPKRAAVALIRPPRLR